MSMHSIQHHTGLKRRVKACVTWGYQLRASIELRLYGPDRVDHWLMW